ncbi:MAG: zinc ABC transporter permease [Bacteroidetes bacterium]|nr:MAG: zinc ABC transporter permease [Bacteroidota bacterium]
MTSPQLEIQIIAVLVALACAIPGTFLVLRKMAMISDAISHSILPGIVVGFFLTHNLSSPWLLFLAAFTGVVTVYLVELINSTKLVKEDASIGIIFPAFFSIGVILISRFSGDVHLDTDAVLVGELAFAPFNRLYIHGVDWGPKAIWVMSGILLTSLLLLVIFYKELKISTFDKHLAASLGFSPVLIHYGLMTMTSLTTVGAFDAVGAILVVALIIVPAATAYLITRSLKTMLLLSSGIGAFSALSGYWLAHLVDASIGGSMAVVLGGIFFLVFLLEPSRGLISVLLHRRRLKIEYSVLAFLIHLQSHNRETEIDEYKVYQLTGHFNWERRYAQKILKLAAQFAFIRLQGDTVQLTEQGDRFADNALHYIITNKSDNLTHAHREASLFSLCRKM